MNQHLMSELERLRAISAGQRTVDQAEILEANEQVERECDSITLPLDTARTREDALELNFAFRSFIVIDATDAQVEIQARLNSRENSNPFFPIRRGTTLKMPKPAKRVFLHWTAQPGKSITILFFFRGQLETNVLSLVNSGGVGILEGTSVTNASVSMGAAAATAIFAANDERVVGTFRNETGASIWVGPSGVTNLTGMEVKHGEVFEWRNTAALYGYVVGATTLITLTQSN